MDFFPFAEDTMRYIECRTPTLIRFTANDIIDQVGGL